MNCLRVMLANLGVLLSFSLCGLLSSDGGLSAYP